MWSATGDARARPGIRSAVGMVSMAFQTIIEFVAHGLEGMGITQDVAN